MKENNHAPSSPARNGELVRAIKAKNDVFHMLDAVSAYLKIHADDPDADKQASSIMDMLKNAATTPLLRAENRARGLTADDTLDARLAKQREVFYENSGLSVTE